MRANQMSIHHSPLYTVKNQTGPARTCKWSSPWRGTPRSPVSWEKRRQRFVVQQPDRYKWWLIINVCTVTTILQGQTWRHGEQCGPTRKHTRVTSWSRLKTERLQTFRTNQSTVFKVQQYSRDCRWPRRPWQNADTSGGARKAAWALE